MTTRRLIMVQMTGYYDLLVTSLGFFLAHLAGRAGFRLVDLGIAGYMETPVRIRHIVGFLVLLVIWTLIFDRFGLYRSRRFSRQRDEIRDILKAQVLGTLAAWIVSTLVFEAGTKGFSLAVFWVTGASMMVVQRLAARRFLKLLRRHGRNLRFLLVVGNNSRAVRFVRRIESSPSLGLRVIGFADTGAGSDGGLRDLGCRQVTVLERLPDFLREHVVDEVVVCLPLKSLYEEASRAVSLCEEQGISVRCLSDLFDVQSRLPQVEQLEDESLVVVSSSTMKGWPMLVKRAFDFAASFLLVVALSPVLVAAAVAVKVSSPGPVFFVQKRLGLNKRVFGVIKFRTMVDGAEKLQAGLEDRNEVSGPVFKIKDDPRITKVGRFLRKTSIDELPQLLNVIKGDMSLVGPRPLPVRDYKGFSTDWHRRRFSVPPGITCLWQINGRSNIGFEKWMELDIEYIDRWSLSLDLEILLKTVPSVFRGHGAA